MSADPADPARPPSASGGPRSADSTGRDELGLDVPVLRALRPFAVAAVVAVVVGRAFAPALAGVGLGSSAFVHEAGVAGAVISQVFAFAAMLLAVLSVLAALRARVSVAVRIGALTLGGFVAFHTAWAVREPMYELSAGLVGAAAALLALLVVPGVMRAPFARAPAVVLGLVGAGALLRLGSVGLALQTAAAPRLVPFARALCTAGFFADAVAVAAAIGWISARARRLTTPASIVVLVIALVCTRQALAGAGDDLRPLDILLWRAAGRLMTRPDPAVPLGFQVFVSFLAPLVGAWALAARSTITPLAAAVALALCAHGSVEMQPCALMLVCAALGLSLSTAGGRGAWAAIAREP